MVYEVKPVKCEREKLGEYTISSGLFSYEGGAHFADILELKRPGCISTDATVKLHMYRCLDYPEEINTIVRTKEYASTERRNEPRWVRKGPDKVSYEGWVWSYGNGWYWRSWESSWRSWGALGKQVGPFGHPVGT